MQKRFYYELMGMATLAILGTLLLVVAVCFSYLNPEYLSEQQREKMILVLMIGIAAIMALCFLLAAIWSHQLGEKLHLGKEVDNELNAKMRQEFTANVSHELKTPLTAISGYSELIENGMISSESEIRRMAGEIHSNSGRLITLINDVIRLSELDEEQEEVLQKIPLLVAAKSCVQMLQINAEKHGVTLTLEGEEVSLWGTRQMVDEVLYNLCGNAIRYNKENGSVTVKVHRQNDCAVLIVQDTGIGIPEECQKRIFERFYRVDKGRSKSTGGTGLGLAIVKHILVRLKGKLSLVSKPGEGTTITIVFPSCEEQ